MSIQSSEKSNTSRKVEYFSVIQKRTSAAPQRYNELRECFATLPLATAALETGF
ncbi:hypothetical protein T11_8022 [Trichinella zimbabwensis]|uniref:Uncharacterized protein n=1 Tax=Trichinella zimbabwensis TaxID=268475 RepID=A0A0V1GH35_9BILA|nr:hypothetical protein T11_8022 [Trichinella zimbabwensis]